MKTGFFLLLLIVFSLISNITSLNGFSVQSFQTKDQIEHHHESISDQGIELNSESSQQSPCKDQGCENGCQCSCNLCFSHILAFHSMTIENITSQILGFNTYPIYLTPSIQTFQLKINRPPKA